VQHDGGVATGHAGIRGVIERLVAMGPTLRNTVVRVVQTGEDLALVYNDWRLSATGRDGRRIERAGKAVEVVRRQADGTWRFVIDDPYARG
jgi:ketosteroid isomerase-like protein